MKLLPVSAFMTSKFCQLSLNRTYVCRNEVCPENGLVKLDDSTTSFELDNFSRSDGAPHLTIDASRIDVEEVARETKIKSLQTEMAILRERGGLVPQRLSPKHWVIMLNMKSPQGRENFLKKLWSSEFEKKCRMKVTEMVRREFEGTDAENGPLIGREDQQHVKYGLNHNTLFRGIYQTGMNKYYYYRLLKAQIFGPNIMVDCRYGKTMDDREIPKCAKDIFQMWQENKIHTNPFNIIFCNLDESSILFRKIKELFLDFEKPDFPFIYTSKSYLDFGEKKNIVYLSPYSENNLSNYDCNNIYVIGALLNNKKRGPVSLGVTKREGLRTAKFPINYYVHWNYGSASLKPSKTLAILNDLKERHGWLPIFKQHLPVKAAPQEIARRQL